MEANYVHKDSTTLVQDKLIKNELNQIELQYNALKQQKFNELLKENQELKKQLENKYSKIGTLTNEVLYEENTKLINQQKEFIKWLENELKSWTEALNAEYDYELVQEFALKCNIYQEILSKYKEIIGDDK